jgi:hypothetical protein
MRTKMYFFLLFVSHLNEFNTIDVWHNFSYSVVLGCENWLRWTNGQMTVYSVSTKWELKCTISYCLWVNWTNSTLEMIDRFSVIPCFLDVRDDWDGQMEVYSVSTKWELICTISYCLWVTWTNSTLEMFVIISVILLWLDVRIDWDGQMIVYSVSTKWELKYTISYCL